MTPQKIKLTQHDGSRHPPVPLNMLVFVQYNDNQEDPFVGGLASHRVWKDVLAYAVIELVEPDPVIEVGDIVCIRASQGGCTHTVIATDGDWVWLKPDFGGHMCSEYIWNLALVRKGGVK